MNCKTFSEKFSIIVLYNRFVMSEIAKSALSTLRMFNLLRVLRINSKDVKKVSYICIMKRFVHRGNMRLAQAWIVVCVAMAAVAVMSCHDHGSAVDRRVVDSLNWLAYTLRYEKLDTTAHYSQMAFDRSEGYDDGRAIALNNLAFVQYMQMDYDSSLTLYKSSFAQTNNSLIQAAADVGIMKICQITGRNDKFYDYRNDALRKLKRIEGDKDLMTAEQKHWYNYTKSEYHFASATYYNNIQQEGEGYRELQKVADDPSLVDSDSAQLARYCLLTGDYDRALEIGRRSGLLYMRASALQKIADRLVNSSQTADEDSVPDLPLRMAQRALQYFRNYGSIYSRAVTYLTISDYYIHQNMPEVALDTATKALEFVNIQHKRLYGSDVEFLMPFSSTSDSVSTEMRWMKAGNISCAWDWIAQIREHLSMVYSSLGLKRQSDYNRNVYLDILNATRQDRQLENQLENLEGEQMGQYVLVWAVAVFSVLVFIALFVYIRFLGKRSDQQYARDIKVVEDTFRKWMQDNETVYSSMTEEEKRIDSETYMHERHIAENKRSYIDKCTSISLVYSITPFLDRAINEVRKLKDSDESTEVKKERLAYLMELTDRINLYNEILSHWIKVRQGIVSLNIENFCVQPLMDTLAKNSNTFANKGLSLSVCQTDAVVKADKALTLFMMNTLLDNARKYTPRGGSVKIEAVQGDGYVEISVSDTGRGLSVDDMNTIRHEKVYDSTKIGDAEHDEELRQSKGFGFGLMNCKGIIDKYRKTNPLFSVCLFDVESKIGQGSRFYFRLPKGVMRSGIMAVMLLASLSGYCQPQTGVSQPNDMSSDNALSDYIDAAARYADSVYFANIDGLYEKAVAYADSTLEQLNADYLQQYPDAGNLLSLYGDRNYAELDWWNSEVNTNYAIILDVRNETAVAALALQDWELYKYNNEIYQRLYKLTNFDYALEKSVTDIHKSNIVRRTIIVVAVVLIIIGLIAFLVVYYRIHLLPIFNLRQLMQFNKKLFTQKHPDLSTFIFQSINDIKQTDGVMIGILHAEDSELDMQMTRNCPFADVIGDRISKDMHENRESSLADGRIRTFLLVPKSLDNDEGGEEGSTRNEWKGESARNETVGVLAVVFHNPVLSENDERIIRLVAQQTATYIYYANVKVENQQNLLQLKDDENRRTEREENGLHIQNMVLDNCLSAIKHETMYYPNRIKQILSAIDFDSKDNEKNDGEMKDRVDALDELINYYKDVFSLLSSCAAKQLDHVMFKRKTIPVTTLAQYAEKTMRRLARKKDVDIDFKVDAPSDLSVVGDVNMLEYLVDNIIESLLQCEDNGSVKLGFSYDDGMVRLRFVDCRTRKNDAELATLFYPEHLKYDEQEDRLVGVEYLVCRQIVREHDEYGGNRRCRINVANCDEGYEIVVVLNGQTNNCRMA